MLNEVTSRVESLINRIGRDIQIISYSKSGTYDPVYTPNVPLDTKAAVLDHIIEEQEGVTIIKHRCKKFLVSTNIEINEDDVIVDFPGLADEQEYYIAILEKIGPGDNGFYYRAIGRRNG